MPSSFRNRAHGLTLLELLLALGVAGILAVIAVAGFNQVLDRTRTESAKGDIALLQMQIERYRSQHFRRPDDLAAIGQGAFLDPWDRPYHYTRLEGTKGKGVARKDRKLNPLNTDYDLFSAGKDGVFKNQVSNKDSLDDIIRAHDGAYVGLAADF